MRILQFSSVPFKTSTYYFLTVQLNNFSKIKRHKEVTTSRNQRLSYYFCFMIEGSGSGYGSVSLTNGSGCGSGRPKNIWIRNTDANYYLAVTPILLIAGHGEISGYRAPRGVGALLAGGGGRGRPLALRRGHFVGLIKVPAFHSDCLSFFQKKLRAFAKSSPPLSLSGNCYSCSFYHDYRHLVCFHCTIHKIVKVWCLIQVALYFSFCLPEMKL
jgi:hypothetical protein